MLIKKSILIIAGLFLSATCAAGAAVYFTARKTSHNQIAESQSEQNSSSEATITNTASKSDKQNTSEESPEGDTNENSTNTTNSEESKPQNNSQANTPEQSDNNDSQQNSENLSEEELERLRALYATPDYRMMDGAFPGDPNKGFYIYADRCPKGADTFNDPWGFGICSSSSYAAFKVYQTYGYMPYFGGYPKQWIENAQAHGYKIGSTPKVGSVSVIVNGNSYGHVAWVEEIYGDRIRVSQYNYAYQYWNDYTEMWIDSSRFDCFIYFDSKVGD